MTPELLRRCIGCTASNAERFAAPLTDAMMFYGVDTLSRQADFLAQVGHESGRLQYTAEMWGPTDAQRRYEGRADLGNTQPGDGSRYRGHGLIQVTGRANHAAARDRMRAAGIVDVPDFEAQPTALMLPIWAAMSAGDFWKAKGCNALSDAGDFEGLTRRINGGRNGLADRQALRRQARAALGLPA